DPAIPDALPTVPGARVPGPLTPGTERLRPQRVRVGISEQLLALVPTLLLRVHLAAERVDLLVQVVDLLLIPGLHRRGGERDVDGALRRLIHGPGALRKRHGRNRKRRDRDPLLETVHRPSPEERPVSGSLLR